MPFDLAFHPEALRERQKLSAGIREQCKNQLAERLIEPRIPASQLPGSTNRYKIKLRTAVYRQADQRCGGASAWRACG